MDIVIIGGGVIGTSLAYWLADKSKLAVTLLEANANFAQNGTASFASAGLLTPAAAIGTNPAITRLIKRGFDLYPELAARLKKDHPELAGSGYFELDQLRVATTEAEAAELSDRQHWYVEAGLATDARWLSPREVAEVEPLTGPNFGAIHHKGGLLRPPWLTRTLARAAAAKGVTIKAGNPVASLITGNGKVTGIQLQDGEIIQSEKVVVAAGAWSGVWLEQQLERLNITTPGLKWSQKVKPVRGQLLAVLPPPGTPPLRHILAGAGGYGYPRADGSIAFGATEEHEAGFEVAITPDGYSKLFSLMQSLAPSLLQAPVSENWSGLRPGSRDGLPLMGELPQLPGLWLATGHFRSGIVMAPSSAELLSEALISGSEESKARLKAYNDATQV
jgi:glycine oxidase